MVDLPKPNFAPPFNITRMSHVVLTVRDLGAARAFYADALGLIVTEQTADTLYLRAIGEICHHSLVLVQSREAPVCRRLGLRVFNEEDLERAHHHYSAAGLPACWAEVAQQGRTLHVSDPFGMPLEFCATMPTQPRLYMDWRKYQGGSPLQLDHTQMHVTDLQAVINCYAALGFRISEYVVVNGRMSASFMYRKGGPFDLVFMTSTGPRLHHFAYAVPGVDDVVKACDICGDLGFGDAIERGPGRHGPGGAFFVYLRDPDGHRIELFNNHYLTIDIETEPVCWSRDDRRAVGNGWGLPPKQSWFDEASLFEGVAAKPLT